jgi:hypothetical protein
MILHSNGFSASCSLHLNRPPPNLVPLQTFKQRFEVALAKAFVGFALDEFKEHRAQQGLAAMFEKLS